MLYARIVESGGRAQLDTDAFYFLRLDSHVRVGDKPTTVLQRNRVESMVPRTES